MKNENFVTISATPQYIFLRHVMTWLFRNNWTKFVQKVVVKVQNGLIDHQALRVT